MSSSESNLGRNLAVTILLPRFLRVAAWAYGLACAALWISLFIGFLTGNDLKPSNSIGPDFSAFYTAAWLIHNGHADALYDFARQLEVQRQLNLNSGANDFSAWVHPPHGALFLAPLANFSPRTAYAIYCFLLFACFAGGLWILRKLCPRLQEKQFNSLWILALLSSPVFFSFSAGQNTGLMFLLHAAVLSALVQNREGVSGFSTALGLLKPHLFLLWLPFWVAARKWRAILTFSAGALVVVALSLWFFGTDVFAREWQTLQSPLYQRYETAHAYKMFSWTSFWRLLLGHNMLSTLLGVTCALLVLGRTSWLWLKFHEDVALLGAFSTASMVLIVPHLPVYDLALLLIPVLVILDRVLIRPLEEFLSLRLALVALAIFTALGDEWARQTHFQVVVPLTTWAWWRAQSLLYENHKTI